MTTPERLKRRQIRESIGLLLLGIAVVFSTVYDSQQRDHQSNAFKSCIAVQVGALTRSLDARAALTDPRAQSVSDLISELLAAKGDQAAGQAAVAKYERKQKELAALAAAHPIPPFPSGRCGGDERR